MKKFFVYQLKKCLAPFLIILFAGAVFYVFPLQLATGNFYYGLLEYIGYLMFVLGAACALVPVWQFAYKTEKRSTDLFYSLPMTKTKQLAVRYITGFITIVAAYSVVYLLGFLVTVIKFGGDTNAPKFIYYLWLYLSSIIPAYIIYSVSSFAFTRANSSFDGVLFILFAMTAVYMAALFLSTLTKYETTEYFGDGIYINVTESYIKSSLYFAFSPLNEVTCIFQDFLCGYEFSAVNPFADLSDPEAVNLLISFIIYPVISAGCTWALFYTEKNSKAENCNQVSQSVFGYKVMLPMYTFVVCAIMGDMWFTEDFVLLLLIAGIIYAFAALYKKSFKIGVKFAAVLIVCAAAGLVIGTITGGVLAL